ncbi:MAG: zinc ribbon domain-containing protein [Gemmatimonadetes bacterium]|nr:zinc ribbon domain-containing protein [Gemmatimonadota bacterium]
MPVYVYETVPHTPGEAPQRFEVRQSMAEAPLTSHPESGAPVRRVLTGGLVTFTHGAAGGTTGTPAMPQGGCGAGCACAH